MIKVYTDLDDFMNDYKYNGDVVFRDNMRLNLREYGHLIIIDGVHYCCYNPGCTGCSLSEECHKTFNNYIREKKLERICNED